MKKLADTIVFDIVDELTDEKGFDAWWHGLCADKRDRLTKVMSDHVTSNILRQCEVNRKRMANVEPLAVRAAIGGTGGCLNS